MTNWQCIQFEYLCNRKHYGPLKSLALAIKASNKQLPF